jgi:cytochrome P450
MPVFGLGNTVLLPASQTQFVVDQPEHSLSLHEAVVHTLQLDYTLIDPNLVHHPVHHQLITTKLTSQVGDLAPEIADETESAIKNLWGIDTREWREVCVWETMRPMVGSSTNRVLIGAPLCRNMDLIDSAMSYAQAIMPVAQVLRQVWTPLRYLVSLLVTIPTRFHERKFKRLLRAEIERRLHEYDWGKANQGPRDCASVERNDFLQWCIKQAKDSGDPYMSDWKTLAGRLLILNLAAIHNSSFTITHAILDLIGSKQEYIDELRHEISTVLAAHDGQWNKKALAKMEKLDSALRESLRLNSFMILGLGRIVAAKDGITTPSGVHLPRGTTISVPTYTVLHDNSIFPDAHEYKPFRFAELRHEDGIQYTKRARNAFSATSNDYLVWGHGKGACIGRFFAANNLKIILGHAIMHYDFELLGSRPRNMWVGFYRIPPMKATIRVRRREVE